MVLFNVMVIMAVKRRRRLQTNTNILLACLAATDALTGLINAASVYSVENIRVDWWGRPY